MLTAEKFVLPSTHPFILSGIMNAWIVVCINSTYEFYYMQFPFAITDFVWADHNP